MHDTQRARRTKSMPYQWSSRKEEDEAILLLLFFFLFFLSFPSFLPVFCLGSQSVGSCQSSSHCFEGVKSEGMVLCAVTGVTPSTPHGDHVEMVGPPADAEIGQRVTFPGMLC